VQLPCEGAALDLRRREGDHQRVRPSAQLVVQLRDERRGIVPDGVGAHAIAGGEGRIQV
jgi:hypothetical protein